MYEYTTMYNLEASKEEYKINIFAVQAQLQTTIESVATLRNFAAKVLSSGIGSLHIPGNEIVKENSPEFKNPDIREIYDSVEGTDSHKGVNAQNRQEKPKGVIVQTEYGSVKGYVDTVATKTVNIFKGIPFAAPPERFQKPKPHKKWTGILETTKYGEECLQINLRGVTGNEDCLYLNIWSPHIYSENELLPVMVWIYGGAFIIGSSSTSLYDGSQIAARGKVVVVSFNYRLGPLGFLSTGDANAPGNYGLWDQHEAIVWVKRNIKAFGGDPNYITLFGQSAGAASVNFQILSPHNKGLIKRAISESGVANSPFALVNDSLNWAQKIAKKVDCSYNDTKCMINCLKTVDGKKLTMAMPFKNPLRPTMRAVIWAPVIDGDFLPDDLKNLFSNAADVDYIAGVNNWDGFLFAMVDVDMWILLTRLPEPGRDNNTWCQLSANHLLSIDKDNCEYGTLRDELRDCIIVGVIDEVLSGFLQSREHLTLSKAAQLARQEEVLKFALLFEDSIDNDNDSPDTSAEGDCHIIEGDKNANLSVILLKTPITYNNNLMQQLFCTMKKSRPEVLTIATVTIVEQIPAIVQSQVKSGDRKTTEVLIIHLTNTIDKKAIDGIYEIYSRANGNLTKYSEIKQAIIDFETDFFLVSTQVTLNLHQKNARNASTYSYVFSYAKFAKGAVHAEELFYVFGIPFFLWIQPPPNVRKISNYMIGYWTNFAHTGNPNEGGYVVPDLWQPYNIKDAYYLEISNPLSNTSVKQHLREDFVSFWVDVFPNL
ncbi:bile salt-activated lipase-like [Cetorhinus maximus]